jgi:hypothetical protein
MFADAEDKVHVVYAPVKNSLELGSKHGTLAKYAVAKYGKDLLFISAGELRKIKDLTWQFNCYSGTFMEGRVAELKDLGESGEVESAVLDRMAKTLGDYNFIKANLSRLNPFNTFIFYNVPYPTEKFPFKSIVGQIGDKEDYPYIIPYDGKTVCTHFQIATATISDFLNIGSINKELVRVNAYAESTMVETGAIAKEEIQNYKYPRPTSQRSNLKAIDPRQPVFVTVYPHQFDFKNASKVLRDLGVAKYKEKRDWADATATTPDYFDIEGETWDLWFAGMQSRVKVGSHLATSNNVVYRATLGAKPVILKIAPLYPFNKTTLSDMGRSDAKLYGIPVAKFVVPKRGAVAIIIPDLGSPIYTIPLDTRQSMYDKFKRQVFEKYMKTVSESLRTYRSYYNDIKPENITVDEGGDFHLIDPDTTSYTPEWYGPESQVGTVDGQLFGLLLVFYWFKTGERPFKQDPSDEAKSKWVRALPRDSRLRTMFHAMVDPGLTTGDRLQVVAEFATKK